MNIKNSKEKMFSFPYNELLSMSNCLPFVRYLISKIQVSQGMFTFHTHLIQSSYTRYQITPRRRSKEKKHPKIYILTVVK